MLRTFMSVCALLTATVAQAQVRQVADGDSVRVPIFVYHTVAPHKPGQNAEQRQLDVDTGVFRQQMTYLAQHGVKVISFASLVQAIEQRTPIPEHSVVLTFDDSWLTQYEFAYPILKQLGFTATFFIITGAINKDDGYMKWDQLKELQSAGMTIAAHTRTHPKLTAPGCSLNDEIVGSREDIQHNLGTTPEFFAYPYGDWDDHVLDVVKSAGFRAARALSGGEWNSPSTLFALHAVLATDDMTLFERAVGP